MQFILHLAGYTDHAAETAHKALLGIIQSEEERKTLEEQWTRRTAAVEILKKHRQVLLEVILCRHVDNYLNYISSLLFEVFTSRPETLRSSDQVDFSTVLTHSSIKDLVQTLAKRRVEKLSYSSFKDLNDYFGSRFHIPLASDKALKQIVEAVEIRNICVHNRCVINERYVSRTGAPSSQLGKTKQIYIEFVQEIVATFADSVRSVDRMARNRLRLRGSRFDIRQLAWVQG